MSKCSAARFCFLLSALLTWLCLKINKRQTKKHKKKCKLKEVSHKILSHASNILLSAPHALCHLRERERQSQRETERERQSQRETETETERHGEIERERERDRERDRETETERNFLTFNPTFIDYNSSLHILNVRGNQFSTP